MIDHGPLHAPLPPSGAEQWANCSGSVAAQAPFPNTDTEQSREGTAAHWLMAEVLNAHRERSGGATNTEPTDPEEYLGRTAENGVIIDAKIVEGATVIIDDVLQTCERHGFDLGFLLLEHRVDMPDIHPQNWGTLDVSAFIPAGRFPVLYLWDYKHGHRECRAFENLQLIDYLRGLCNKHGINGLDEQHITAVLRIVQPLAYHATGGPISEWVVKLSDLRAYWNKMAAAAHAAFNNPTLSTGLWCRDCLARGTCSAVRSACYNFIDEVDRPYAMDEMTGADLAVERGVLRDGLEVAKKRLEAIEDQLEHQIRDGDGSSGLALETKPGREEWSVPAGQAIALANQFGVDIAVESAKTPTQTRAAAPKQVRQLLTETMKQFTRRPAGSLKLVPADESRTARAFQRRK